MERQNIGLIVVLKRQGMTDFQLDRLREEAGTDKAFYTYLRKRFPKLHLAETTADFLVKGQADYPQKLAEIAGSPWLLYWQGHPTVLKGHAVAIVGSRQASAAGIRKARETTSAFVSVGFITISGLAVGVDSAVHEETLKAGGKTVAVLAHGLDRIYPQSNEGLARRLLAQGGVLLSEHSPGTPPLPHHFLARNRIVTGLADYVVIVEAGLPSGSLSSANWAAEMGKEVLAVPGSPGTDLLIEEGAIPLENPADLTAILSR